LPEEPEATAFVNNCASFLAPVSTSLAYKPAIRKWTRVKGEVESDRIALILCG
jgi:hypothetical protein